MLFWALSLLVAPALARDFDVPDDNRMVQRDGLIRFPIRVSEGAPVVKGANKRQNDVGLKSQRNGYLYTIDLSIGTPGDAVSLNFDTGSAEFWVNPVCSQSNNPTFCESFPRFNNSSTLEDLGTQTRLSYGSGYADINYMQDYVLVGSAKVSQQIFGIAYDSSTISVGVLGAGPPLSGWTTDYPTIFDTLVKQGFMNSRAYSLDIRSIGSSRGSVVFGGIDIKKFSGKFEKLSVIPAEDSPDQNTRWWVNLDGVALTSSNGTKTPIFSAGSQPVLLDSGYTVNALPSAIFQPLLNAFPTVKITSGSSLYEVDCNVGNIKGSVDFTFGGTVITVPYRDFIWKQPSGTCILGAFQDDTFPVLGDTFLRAAYVVYDWDNKEVHIANNEDCGSKLVTIGSGPNAVPSLVGECGISKTSTTPQHSTPLPTPAHRRNHLLNNTVTKHSVSHHTLYNSTTTPVVVKAVPTRVPGCSRCVTQPNNGTVTFCHTQSTSTILAYASPGIGLKPTGSTIVTAGAGNNTPRFIAIALGLIFAMF